MNQSAINSRYICFIVLTSLICAFTTGCRTLGRCNTHQLAGTTWRGKDSDGDFMICEFETNGKLHYTTPSGDFSNGTWQQQNASIYMECNKRYSEYFGTIADSRMTGTARNIKNHKWIWQLEKCP